VVTFVDGKNCVIKAIDDILRDDFLHVSSPMDTRMSLRKTFFIKNTTDQDMWIFPFICPTDDFSLSIFSGFYLTPAGNIVPQLTTLVFNTFTPVLFVMYVTDGGIPTVGKFEVWIAQGNNVLKFQKRHRNMGR
jgi:hypothetical protein